MQKAKSQVSVAHTLTGRLGGSLEDGIHAFKGIPYGGNSSGSGRFRRARRVEAWSDIRDARQYGPMCPQSTGTGPFDPQMLGLLEGGYEIPAIEPDENCLVLNVWTPGLRDGGRRPVMVWCHGGRFSEGSGGNPWCDGALLAMQGDVVVVTLNHRLNVFGFLNLGELSEVHAGESANTGMLDIIAALEWIRDNITEFGGDPGNVTIFGSSGGGSKVTTLLAMPAAKGLFHKAIVQSATLRGASSTAARQHAVALAICAQLGLKPSHLDALRTTSAGRLVRAGKAVESLLAGPADMGIFVPAVDGASLHEHPFGDNAPELSADIPLLIGTNSDEMTLLLDRSLLAVDSEDLSSTLQRWSGIGAQAANELVAQYLDMLPMAGPRDLLVAIATDYALRSSAIIQAEFKSQQCAPVYMYQFCWRVPACGGTFGATHGAEVPFIFGNVARATGFAAAPSHYRSLEKKMLAAWSSFARNGNPNHVDLPPWPVYSADDRSTMCFGQTASGEKSSSDECVVVRDPGRAGRLAMRAIDSHRRVEARQT